MELIEKKVYLPADILKVEVELWRDDPNGLEEQSTTIWFKDGSFKNFSHMREL